MGVWQPEREGDKEGENSTMLRMEKRHWLEELFRQHTVAVTFCVYKILPCNTDPRTAIIFYLNTTPLCSLEASKVFCIEGGRRWLLKDSFHWFRGKKSFCSSPLPARAPIIALEYKYIFSSPRGEIAIAFCEFWGLSLPRSDTRESMTSLKYQTVP